MESHGPPGEREVLAVHRNLQDHLPGGPLPAQKSPFKSRLTHAPTPPQIIPASDMKDLLQVSGVDRATFWFVGNKSQVDEPWRARFASMTESVSG